MDGGKRGREGKGRGKRGKKSKRVCVERPKMPVKHQGLRCDAKPTQAVFVTTRSAKHEHAKHAMSRPGLAQSGHLRVYPGCLKPETPEDSGDALRKARACVTCAYLQAHTRGAHHLDKGHV